MARPHFRELNHHGSWAFSNSLYYPTPRRILPLLILLNHRHELRVLQRMFCEVMGVLLYNYSKILRCCYILYWKLLCGRCNIMYWKLFCGRCYIMYLKLLCGCCYILYWKILVRVNIILGKLPRKMHKIL